MTNSKPGPTKQQGQQPPKQSLVKKVTNLFGVTKPVISSPVLSSANSGSILATTVHNTLGNKTPTVKPVDPKTLKEAQDIVTSHGGTPRQMSKKFGHDVASQLVYKNTMYKSPNSGKLLNPDTINNMQQLVNKGATHAEIVNLTNSTLADVLSYPKPSSSSSSSSSSSRRSNSVSSYASDALGALDFYEPDATDYNQSQSNNLEVELIIEDLMNLLESLLLSVFRCNK